MKDFISVTDKETRQEFLVRKSDIHGVQEQADGTCSMIVICGNTPQMVHTITAMATIKKGLLEEAGLAAVHPISGAVEIPGYVVLEEDYEGSMCKDCEWYNQETSICDHYVTKVDRNGYCPRWSE